MLTAGAALRRALLHRFKILTAFFGILLVYTILNAPSGASVRATQILTDKLKAWPFASTPAGPRPTAASHAPETDDRPSTADAAEQSPPGAATLEALCSRTSWRPNLSLHCSSRCGPDRASICGGLNNARDRLQTCVRLAIDAGAATLVVPSVAARSESALWAIDPSQVAGATGEPVVLCAEAWFSLATLRGELGRSCPQLRVEAVCPPGGGLGAAGGDAVVEMPWRPLGGERYDSRPGRSFREAVDRELGAERAREMVAPVLVDYGDPYIAWNYTPGGEIYTIFKDLFRAVDYNPDLLALGRRITESTHLRGAPYAGVHLRAEADWPASWGSLEEQTRMYAAELQRLRGREEPGGRLRAVYLSCGNRSAIQRFREAVEPLGFSVLDKWTVFEEDWPEGLRAVEALSFDQKAVVEFVPLTQARYFLGLRLSSMSVVVAQSRTLDEEGDFFENHVDGAGSEADSGGRTLAMRGNENTRLLAIGGIEDW